MKESSLVEVNNVSKKYNTSTVVIKDCKLTARITTIVGANGCGKSTLLKAIAKVISFEGEIKTSLQSAYMPENTYFPLDTRLIEFLNCHQLMHGYDQTKAMDFIFLFGLESKLGEKLHTLSKGMKAKVNLIVTLSQTTDLYLLDEPFTALDLEGSQKLIDYIKKDDKVYIISSHQDSLYKELGGDVISL